MLTKKVSSFLYNGVDYKPGDKFEVEPRLYRADFMTDLTPSKVVESVVEEVATVKTSKKRRAKAEPTVEEVPIVVAGEVDEKSEETLVYSLDSEKTEGS
jgi:hypothetical protein